MPPTPDRLPDGRRDRCVGDVVRTVHQIFRSVDTFSKRAQRSFGVSGPQLWALRTIEDAGEMTVGELASAMYLHISTVSGIVDRLVREGFVVRERSRTDRRVVRLRMTAAGRAILSRAPEAPRSRVLRGLRRLPVSDLYRLRGALRLLDRLMHGRTHPDRCRAG